MPHTFTICFMTALTMPPIQSVLSVNTSTWTNPLLREPRSSCRRRFDPSYLGTLLTPIPPLKYLRLRCARPQISAILCWLPDGLCCAARSTRQLRLSATWVHDGAQTWVGALWGVGRMGIF